MTKFRTRLLIALITLIITVLVGLGLLLGQLFKSYYSSSFDERLKKESNFLSMYIKDKGGITSLTRQDILKVSDLLKVRATITNSEGTIMLDSGYLTQNNTNELRTLIHEVIKKEPKKEGMSEEGDGYNLHYYWKPIENNGAKEGYIFLSTKTSELNKAYGQIWWILSLCLGIAFIVIFFLGIRITSRYTKPIESAANVAIELANGNYRARTTIDPLDVTGMLGSSINMLAENLEELVKTQEVQQDRLSALIENMGAGLILIDSRGYINLINKGYVDIFQIDPSHYLDKLYYEVIDQQEICNIVAEVFRTEQKVDKQIVVPLFIERRYFVVYGIPIIGSNNVWKGVLLVFHDITELKKLEQMRKDFVANVSHELKTPVTSIKGFTETLLDGAMNHQETLESFLSIISKESERLQILIQDLLDLSKIEQQGFILSIEDVDIYQLLEDVISLLTRKAEEKNIKLEFYSKNKQALVKGDFDRLKQIFINLIANAITYTPPEGEIKVILVEQRNKVRVHIKDTGIGIEKAEIPRIFERFYRVDRARSRNSGGTGLGLAIVKHLIEAHHGSISVKSEVGEGSEFIIELYKQMKS